MNDDDDDGDDDEDGDDDAEENGTQRNECTKKIVCRFYFSHILPNETSHHDLSMNLIPITTPQS